MRLFLKNHPWVIAESFHKIADANYVVSEYPFGSDYRADFVVLGGYSGGWEIHFIELEPPDAPLFTRSGAMAKRLNSAFHQVDCWRIFIDQNRQDVLRELSKFAMRRDLLRGPRAEEPTDSVGWRLDHPKSSLHFYFDVVIGRRDALDRDELVRKAAFGANHRIEVMTYDRFIPAIRKIDQQLSVYGYE
ncbi:MAG: Shedu anti-phage system protein SduA domain-containing protein [Verrucomicrobiota bacterium]